MKKTKILLVDDDTDFCAASKTIIEQAGYDVIIAQDGKTGLNKAKIDAPDIIILDVMLPDINGYSVCLELKEDPKYSVIPIILLTAIGAKPGSYAEHIGIQHKADAFLEKPVILKLFLKK
ncbi:MAG: response regulator [bacterium]|nr:response regulator [bacterium]